LKCFMLCRTHLIYSPNIVMFQTNLKCRQLSSPTANIVLSLGQSRCKWSKILNSEL
jgi:uncharacterized protein YcsI (UPF0317 family)